MGAEKCSQVTDAGREGTRRAAWRRCTERRHAAREPLVTVCEGRSLQAEEAANANSLRQGWEGLAPQEQYGGHLALEILRTPALSALQEMESHCKVLNRRAT